MSETVKNTGKRNLIAMGLIVTVAGTVWLLYKMNLLDLPEWIFSWKMFIVIAGIFSGINNRFKGLWWIATIVIGLMLMLFDATALHYMRPYTWPLLLVVLGIFIILGAIFKKPGQQKEWGGNGFISSTGGEDFLEQTSVFGGAKRKIFSKNFRGGEIVAVFGGAEIDLTQADITGNVTLEITNIFGGTKLVVPANWEVRTEMTTIMGGCDDKRAAQNPAEPPKILTITGFCLFGGVDIRNY